MEKRKINIITCGHFDREVIPRIAESIVSEFHHPIQITECTIDISGFYHPGRRQYDANGLLKIISDMAYPESTKTIGLFRVDLFIPILTYIFGQAILNGNTGVASLFRLKNELYGLEQNQSLLLDRFCKVVIHELGHMFGLIHCQHPSCVMRSSTYVEDIDQKKIHFCSHCRSQINLRPI